VPAVCSISSTNLVSVESMSMTVILLRGPAQKPPPGVADFMASWALYGAPMRVYALTAGVLPAVSG